MGRKTFLDPIRYPVVSRELRELCVENDGCPECGGELDTGWECNDCDFDGKPIMDKLRGDLFNGVQIDGFNLD